MESVDVLVVEDRTSNLTGICLVEPVMLKVEMHEFGVRFAEHLCNGLCTVTY
jgi:hypothetical protein